ncbi:MAG TPA: tRNA lysidine(34) synthetase TilS [Bryobacteraceae bacterium]|nr:tRNA lysidine(34) synthetase TilS [Bryobacteraceae bacterium]
MLARGTRVIPAVSGGADSVCLLHVLRELAPRFGAIVAGVAHLNHKLRGGESEEDERFVAEIAAKYGLPFYREEADLQRKKGNLEQAAREARRKFFAELLKQGAADRIATGHTSNDQAETVLFRIVRGCGIAGLAGILPATAEGLIRPLLDVSRAEAVDYLSSRGIAWREDSTNRDSRFARNRIRHELLPQLAREWNPRIGEALAHLADVAREDERWWAAETGRRFEDLFTWSDGGLEVCASDLAGLPRAAGRRQVRLALERQALRPCFEYRDVERVLEFARRPSASGILQLPGVVVARSFDRLRFTSAENSHSCRPAPEPVSIQAPGVYEWAGSRLWIEESETNLPARGCARLKVCGGRIFAPFELRGWRAGDHYRPAGRTRDRKIKKMFQEAGVPSWERRSWPILTSGSNILWSREFGPAAEYAADQTGPALCIWEERGSH